MYRACHHGQRPCMDLPLQRLLWWGFPHRNKHFHLSMASVSTSADSSVEATPRPTSLMPTVMGGLNQCTAYVYAACDMTARLLQLDWLTVTVLCTHLCSEAWKCDTQSYVFWWLSCRSRVCKCSMSFICMNSFTLAPQCPYIPLVNGIYSIMVHVFAAYAIKQNSMLY